MKENNIFNNKSKAIIITVVSIIAVLGAGIGLGVGINYLIEKNLNKKATSTQTENVINVDEMDESKLEEISVEDRRLLEEQERLIEQQQKDEETQKLEEEENQKKIEEQKKAEELKKQQENKKKDEEKTTVTTVKKDNGYPYYIKVNYLANTVTIYGKDSNGNYTVPVKAMVCSSGRQTPHSGVYRTPSKVNWGQLIGPVWGQYCTRIVGGILFHSVPYLKNGDKSSLEYWEYDRLGEARSLGCIRLTVADAKWIFYNCPVGTSVEFYGSSNPGPLGKPSAPKVSWAGDPYRGWDPTDPDPNNPWRTKAQEDAKKKAEEEAKKKAEEAKKKAEEEAKKKEEEKNKIVVPNVVGKTEAEAKTLLKELKIEVRYNEGATSNDGLVSNQSITSSSKVTKGTSIIIWVNKVKKTTNTTNLSNTVVVTNTTKSSNTTKTTNSVDTKESKNKTN